MNKEKDKKLPLVVICGRTNVGKSTLFNCLVEKNQALVSDISGTTRDSNFGLVEWNNSAFDLVDTAGLIDWRYLKEKKIKGDDIETQTQKQAKKYLDESNLILFMVDTKAGLTIEDRELARTIREISKYKNKTILIANKIDNFNLAPEAAQFNKLGLGEPILISAANGLGTGDLLDIVVNLIDKKKKSRVIIKEKKEKTIDVCLLGKPNVGKSSLLNAILGYERVIVSPIAHTTREPQNIELEYKNEIINLVAVSYTHLRAHETVLDLVCRLLLEKKKKNTNKK